jgi:uncharacterized protein YegJ (DUF2314 family)
MRRIVVVVAIVAGALALLGGAAAVVFLLWHVAQIHPQDRSSSSDAPPGPAMAPVASFELAVYLPARPARDPQAAVDALLAGEFAGLRRVAAEPDGTREPQVLVRLETDVPGSYAPPDAEGVERFGHGLTPAQRAMLRDSRRALVMKFAVPRAQVFAAGRLACALAGELGAATDGVVWDEETREVFAPAAWKAQRVEEWTEAVPDVSRHTVIHLYQDGEYARAITLGLAKFGLPDLVVQEVAWSGSSHAGTLLNLTAQRLAEGGTVGSGGELRLRLADVRSTPMRAHVSTDGSGEALVVLRTAPPEEGDPENRLLALSFDRDPGVDVHSRMEHALSVFFGATDDIRNVTHDEAILAASARARERLPALHDAFVRGLAPGEILMVKAGFAKPDGAKEWMWIEVTSWKGTTINGLLQNDPFEVPDLHAGQKVTVAQRDVFDYLLKRRDGTVEGNETSALIEARSQPAATSARR